MRYNINFLPKTYKGSSKAGELASFDELDFAELETDSEFDSDYEKSAVLRALIQETFSNRPAYLCEALRRALKQVRVEVSAEAFLGLVRKNIRDVYKERDRQRPWQSREHHS